MLLVALHEQQQSLRDAVKYLVVGQMQDFNERCYPTGHAISTDYLACCAIILATFPAKADS